MCLSDPRMRKGGDGIRETILGKKLKPAGERSSTQLATFTITKNDFQLKTDRLRRRAGDNDTDGGGRDAWKADTEPRSDWGRGKGHRQLGPDTQQLHVCTHTCTRMHIHVLSMSMHVWVNLACGPRLHPTKNTERAGHMCGGGWANGRCSDRMDTPCGAGSHLPRMETLLRNSSYILRFLSVLPCLGERGTEDRLGGSSPEASRQFQLPQGTLNSPKETFRALYILGAPWMTKG